MIPAEDASAPFPPVNDDAVGQRSISQNSISQNSISQNSISQKPIIQDSIQDSIGQNATTSEFSALTEPIAPAPPPQNPPANQGTYAEKTERIRAVSQLIDALKPIIWTVVIIVVVIPLIGKFVLGQAIAPRIAAGPAQGDKPAVVRVEPAPDLSQLDQAVAAAVRAAHDTARAYAAAELDRWQAELEPRVENFLDWYFDFFNQKRLEFTAPFTLAKSAIYHALQPNSPGPQAAVAESFTAEFQREFAKRVLVPRNAQLRLELLTNETVNLYLTELGKNIEGVRNAYRVPQGQWDRYLSDISTTINDTEGNISNLSLKLLVGGGGYLLAKPLVAVSVGKIGSKITSTLASKAAAKMAAKTGATVAAEFGTSLIDPLVGVGILLWDLWDYNHTVATDRPVLQTNLLDYLQDMKRSLLTDSETGVMAAVNQIEANLLQSLHTAAANP
ncbi:MAG: hypothetical protein EDM05_61615 [Leptolyngbya sp. IPPAS B-1204]